MECPDTFEDENQELDITGLVRDLNFLPEEYLVVGSAPLAMQNLLNRSSDDVDILASPRLWEYLTRTYQVLHDDDRHRVIRPSDSVEIFATWPGIKFESARREAEIFDGIPFASISCALFYKSVLGRPVDFDDIQAVLENMEIRRGRHCDVPFSDRCLLATRLYS